MKKIQIRCPYCGAKATLRPSSAVYGNAAKTDGYLYVCDRYPKCDAYVAAHRKSRLPMWNLYLAPTGADDSRPSSLYSIEARKNTLLQKHVRLKRLYIRL